MLLLVLDTSSPAVTAAAVRLGDGGEPRLLAEHVQVDGRRHGELLAPGIEAVLRGARGGGRPAAVVVGTGPGPFTGLRVGLVSAAALSDALGVPAYGVCSLDAVARPRRACVVVTDARRREVYWARYDTLGSRVDGPAVERPAGLAERLCGADAPVLCGAGALLHREAFAGLAIEDADPYPLATALAGRAASRAMAGAPPDPLTPLYLRRPDATPPGALKRVTEPVRQ